MPSFMQSWGFSPGLVYATKYFTNWAWSPQRLCSLQTSLWRVCTCKTEINQPWTLEFVHTMPSYINTISNCQSFPPLFGDSIYLCSPGAPSLGQAGLCLQMLGLKVWAITPVSIATILNSWDLMALIWSSGKQINFVSHVGSRVQWLRMVSSETGVRLPLHAYVFTWKRPGSVVTTWVKVLTAVPTWSCLFIQIFLMVYGVFKKEKFFLGYT